MSHARARLRGAPTRRPTAPDLLTCCSSRSLRTGPKPLCTACGAARFVEVKGPGDTMRDGQLAWIDVLVRAGAEVDVAYVQVG